MKKLLSIFLMAFSLNAFAQTNLADVQLKDLNNQPVTLSQYKGKPVYVKMWASWCPICLAGLAEIDDLSAVIFNRTFGICNFLYSKSLSDSVLFSDCSISAIKACSGLATNSARKRASNSSDFSIFSLSHFIELAFP